MGEMFEVKTTPPAFLEYPGQPIGPPEAFLNCRCVLDFSEAIVASATEQKDDMTTTETPPTSGFSGVVLVALPAGDRTVTYADGDTTELHETLAYLGTTDQLAEGERDAVIEAAKRMASSTVPFTARVAGMGALGEDQDSIAITEAEELQALHEMALSSDQIGPMYSERNSHPTWISHVTGEGFAAGDEITFDRIGAWFGGDDHLTFEMTGDMPPESELPVPEEPIAAEDADMPVWGLAAPEGEESGDGRMFAPESLTWRDLPLPLSWQRADMGEHQGKVVVGRVDNLTRVGTDIMWSGVLLTDIAETEEVLSLIAQGALRGVSVDADQGTAHVPTDEEMVSAMESGTPMTDVWDAARISGLTIVQIPAFPEADINLGYPPGEEPADDMIEATADTESFKRGSGWITHPVETRRIHDYWVRGEGAAKIRWGTSGDFTRAVRFLRRFIEPRFLNRTAAQWHHDALGYWPGQCGMPGDPPCGAKRRRGVPGVSADTTEFTQEIKLTNEPAHMAPAITLVAAAPPAVMERSWFDDPKFEGPTALSVDLATGQVKGHIATWDTCHIGIDKVCTTPPRSATDYAHYHLGVVNTTDGELAVGSLTLGTGHADIYASASDTRRHYDHTGTAVAKVRAGEDQFGIWVAGGLCDGVTPEQARTLAAAGGISGDWRTIGGNLELVAGLAVNVPGFPVPRPALAASGDRQTALVAAGIVVANADVNAFASVSDLANAVVDTIEKRQRRREVLASLSPITEEVRQKRLERLADLEASV